MNTRSSISAEIDEVAERKIKKAAKTRPKIPSETEFGDIHGEKTKIPLITSSLNTPKSVKIVVIMMKIKIDRQITRSRFAQLMAKASVFWFAFGRG